MCRGSVGKSKRRAGKGKGKDKVRDGFIAWGDPKSKALCLSRYAGRAHPPDPARRPPPAARRPRPAARRAQPLTPPRPSYAVPRPRSTAFLWSTCLCLYMGLRSWQSMLMSGIAVLTFVFSVNYWRDPIRGTRRNVDLFFAKFSFASHCFFAYLYQRDYRASWIAWPLGVTSASLFLIASLLWRRRSNTWILAHACFHCCVGVNMTMCHFAIDRPDMDVDMLLNSPFAFLEHWLETTRLGLASLGIVVHVP